MLTNLKKLTNRIPIHNPNHNPKFIYLFFYLLLRQIDVIK